MEMITNISVLGWEERALLGFYESAKSMAFNHHILIIYEDYLDVTQPTLDKIFGAYYGICFVILKGLVQLS
jgi:hypothetical protein